MSIDMNLRDSDQPGRRKFIDVRIPAAVLGGLVVAIIVNGVAAIYNAGQTVEKFTALQGRVDAHAGLPAHPRAQDRITRLQSAVENLAKATNRNAETLGDIRNDLRTLVFKLLDRERKAVR